MPTTDALARVRSGARLLSLESMPLRLRDHLSFCVCGGRVILLDIAADRYFCLGPELESAFRRWAAAPTASDEEAGLLHERGLLVPAAGAPDSASSTELPRPVRDLGTGRPPALGDVVRVLAAELAASAWLRHRPLVEVLRQCRTDHAEPEPHSKSLVSRADRIASAFERSAFLLGAADRCLARALAAMRVCHRRLIYPTLIFGVRINPFAAHCWVQLGDSVLVGEFEQVRLFTPILALR